ncbi:hypothetical protein [Stenotrophomonas sp.]|jgi:hypothetical protein|uniref:hypothetical protein n=1 Tax=Stenotrophomonas sp. TaxID=69392 RepID=UPI003340C734
MKWTDNVALEQWCLDVIACFAEGGMPESVCNLFRKAVLRFSGTKKLVDIAFELADLMDGLSGEERRQAQSMLYNSHGFGFEEFLAARKGKRLGVIKCGKLRNESEYRLALNFTSDVDNDLGVAAEVAALIATYEMAAVKTGG